MVQNTRYGYNISSALEMSPSRHTNRTDTLRFEKTSKRRAAVSGRWMACEGPGFHTPGSGRQNRCSPGFCRKGIGYTNAARLPLLMRT
jgi:hypothetical protein